MDRLGCGCGPKQLGDLGTLLDLRLGGKSEIFSVRLAFTGEGSL
jgi:hypothetical protein